ncbi:MAG TPA: prepilin-type N-terminal cleavage/methylation domain-containing protein [Anaeromyxobacteraceae bacterium]|nr:prepilin-type N-terminal cleavage/methylation domain-containing protein [Anaeromyxobacteraceae bacterium]
MTRPTPRGFTLTELLIAALAASIVAVTAISMLTSQQRLFQRSNGERALQETGRIALDEITANLRLAGFGIDPGVAFDFGALASVAMDRAPAGAAVSAASLVCTSPVTCRDSVTGPDQIVFAYRNPGFVRALAAAPSTSTLTLTGPLNAPLYRNQVLQVICAPESDAMRWAYVTVGQYVAPTTAATVSVTLASGNGDQIPYQNGYLTDGCFSAVAPQGSTSSTFEAAAKVYKVERFRYYVATYDAAGTVVANGTAGAKPYLMLDQGLLDASGNAVLSVIAPDVEDLQFAYVFPNSPTTALQVIGATPGTAIASGASGIDLAPAVGSPAFGDAAGSARRATQHPGNIRAVEVAVVARSPEPDTRILDAAIPPSMNRDPTSLAAPAGHRRQLFQTTAAVRNTDARAPYFPVYSTSAGDHYNVGGG